MKLQRKNFETDRLLLKPYEIKYYNDFFLLIQKNKLRLTESFPNTLKATETPENTKSFVQQKIFDWNNNKAYGFLIFEKSVNQLIGYINTKDIDWKKNQTEIAYFIDEDFENKGLTTEALQIILKISFLLIQLNRVFARIATNNIASQKLAEKVGLKYEGAFFQDYSNSDNEIVDTHCFGISKEEFRRL